MNDSTLATTPLFDLHVELGARMVPFAGYSMPVQFPAGVMAEHKHTRDAAGLFDVSHMGQVMLRGAGAAKALERVVPVDVLGLAPGRQRYALLTTPNGGIRDDLMITNTGDHLHIVINAACKTDDLAHLQSAIGSECIIEQHVERALLALQGPKAAAVLARLAPAANDLVFMGAAAIEIAGIPCFVARSGYTGEDGFEISLPAGQAMALARRLLNDPDVAPIGLGARDSLRLEAGLCLYGHDIDTSTSPIEAALLWSISRIRRHDGERAGGFPGAERIFEQIEGGVSRRRVGIRPQGRVPVREGAELVDDDGQTIGKVTSGGFGPTVGGPVAMGYVAKANSAIGCRLNAIVRGKPVPAEVVRMPFVEQRYYRGAAKGA